MQVCALNNTILTDPAILWQYDKAINIIALKKIVDDFSSVAITEFFNMLPSGIVQIKTATDFGLSVWGVLLGVDWPTFNSSGTTKKVSSDMYRKVLLAKLFLIGSNGSVADINRYLSVIFENRIRVDDGFDMSISYTTTSELSAEEEAIKEQLFIYPAGVHTNFGTSIEYIGLNDTQSIGQKKKNLADDQSTTNENAGAVHP